MNQPILLAADEAHPVSVYNEGANSPFVIVCDHAGKALPQSLGDLGLAADQLRAHIAWDIGAEAVARHLAKILDAVLFVQHYSRLVIDCNRPLHTADSITEQTGGITVPGNQKLSPAAVQSRIDGIFMPYHERIRRELETWSTNRPHILISMHSFTPVLYGKRRLFHAGVLWNKDSRLAKPVLELLRAEPQLVVGENEPYAASAATDYSIIEHAELRGAPYVELEVRQDLIAEAAGQLKWAQRLGRCLQTASAMFQY